jgi:MATE family multidrug resistance protein
MFTLDNYIKEIQKLFVLALPLMLVQLFNSGKGIVDTMMVGHIDKINLAGLSLATGVYIVIVLFSAGFGSAVIAVLSRLYATKEYDQIRFYAQQSLYLNLILSFITAGFLINGGFFFSHLDTLEPETRQIATDYLRILGWVYPISSMMFVFRPVMQAFIKNKELLWISGTMFALNIPLNYIFIYGLGSIPAMGAIGSAYSTAICFVLEIGALYWYIRRHDEMNFCKKFVKIDWYEVRKLFLLGLPIGLAIVLEVGLFTFITFLLAKFGEETVGAHHLATNFLGFIFMFSLGLSFALMQRVSFFIGLNETEKVKLTVISSAALSILVSLFTICLTFIFREQIVGLYTSNIHILVIAVNIIIISLFYQLFDGLQITAVGVLRAYKLNRQSFNYALFSYWGVGFVSGYIMANYFNLGVYGYWFGFILCFITASFLNYKKVYQVVWKGHTK